MKRFLLTIFLSLFSYMCIAEDQLYIFHASWCSPCRRLKSFLSNDKDIKKWYSISMIDIDKFPELAKKYRVKSVPTTILLDSDNDEIVRIIGYSKGYKDNLEKLNNENH